MLMVWPRSQAQRSTWGGPGNEATDSVLKGISDQSPDMIL